MDRRQKLLECIDLRTQHGLEIGALHHPVLHRSEGHIRYADHADTATLQQKYADDPAVGEMVDVDVVWGGGPLDEALRASGDEQVDFVLASHVIEHVPDLIGWLAEIARVLPTGGVLTLAIPDKRYCFDARRRESDLSEVIDAWMTKRNRPTPGSVFDFYSRIIEVDTHAVWNGESDYTSIPPDLAQGLEWASKAASSEEYSDVHCWVFTPRSFLSILGSLFELGLVGFEVATFHDTEPGELEFHVSLRRLDPALTPDQRLQVQRGSLPSLTATPESEEAVVVALSRREASLVRAKRQLMRRARRLYSRARPERR